MNQPKKNEIVFEGEEAGAGNAAPGLDLLAAAFLVVLSIVIMIASIRLPVPGEVRSAPGLLPFVIAASLALMAIILGISAMRRRKAGVVMHPSEMRDGTEDRRALLLALVMGIYVAALQFLSFQIFFSVLGVSLVLSAFEPVTIMVLSAIIHFFWRGPLWITVLVSVGWTLTLSLVFQKVFQIPLPGGF